VRLALLDGTEKIHYVLQGGARRQKNVLKTMLGEKQRRQMATL
jgi:hypothetical protein